MRVDKELLRTGMSVYHVCVPNASFSCGMTTPKTLGWINIKTYLGPTNPDITGGDRFADFLLHDSIALGEEGWRGPVHHEFNTNQSLMDMGIVPNMYNTHRTFTTFWEACDYLMERFDVKYPHPEHPCEEIIDVKGADRYDEAMAGLFK